MKYLLNNIIEISPSDLVVFHGSEAAAWAERAALDDPTIAAKKTQPDDLMRLIQRKGLTHEQAVLKKLEGTYGPATDISAIAWDKGADAAFAATLDAIKRGDRLIYQGVILVKNKDFHWIGKPDFMIRQENGDYRVVDAKFGSDVKPIHMLQLLAYVDLIRQVGLPCDDVVQVQLASGDVKDLLVKDGMAYYVSTRDEYLNFLSRFKADIRKMNPPIELNLSTKNYDWQDLVEDLLRKADGLQFVANIRMAQIRKMMAVGINSLTDLANTPVQSVKGIGDKTFEKLRDQAEIQQRSRKSRKIAWEKIAPIINLPPKDPADVKFDMEGFPLNLDGGLEYLFGYWFKGKFYSLWADNRFEEKQAFEAFMNFALGNLKNNPKSHIYHYAHYEVSALRRLAARYGSYQAELEIMISHGVFVDLYKIFMGAFRVGAEGYGLKDIEPIFTKKSRGGAVSKAVDSIASYGQYTELLVGTPSAADIASASKKKQELIDYNALDCENLEALADWMRKNRNLKGPSEDQLDDDASKSESVIDFDLNAARKELLESGEEKESGGVNGVTCDQRERMEKSDIGRTLLGVGEYHRNEEAYGDAEYARRVKASTETIWDDIGCLAAGVIVGEPNSRVSSRRPTLWPLSWEERHWILARRIQHTGAFEHVYLNIDGRYEFRSKGVVHLPEGLTMRLNIEMNGHDANGECDLFRIEITISVRTEDNSLASESQVRAVLDQNFPVVADVSKDKLTFDIAKEGSCFFIETDIHDVRVDEVVDRCCEVFSRRVQACWGKGGEI